MADTATLGSGIDWGMASKVQAPNFLQNIKDVAQMQSYSLDTAAKARNFSALQQYGVAAANGDEEAMKELAGRFPEAANTLANIGKTTADTVQQKFQTQKQVMANVALQASQMTDRAERISFLNNALTQYGRSFGIPQAQIDLARSGLTPEGADRWISSQIYGARDVDKLPEDAAWLEREKQRMGDRVRIMGPGGRMITVPRTEQPGAPLDPTGGGGTRRGVMFPSDSGTGTQPTIGPTSAYPGIAPGPSTSVPRSSTPRASPSAPISPADAATTAGTIAGGIGANTPVLSGVPPELSGPVSSDPTAPPPPGMPGYVPPQPAPPGPIRSLGGGVAPGAPSPELPSPVAPSAPQPPQSPDITIEPLSGEAVPAERSGSSAPPAGAMGPAGAAPTTAAEAGGDISPAPTPTPEGTVGLGPSRQPVGTERLQSRRLEFIDPPLDFATDSEIQAISPPSKAGTSEGLPPNWRWEKTPTEEKRDETAQAEYDRIAKAAEGGRDSMANLQTLKNELDAGFVTGRTAELRTSIAGMITELNDLVKSDIWKDEAKRQARMGAIFNSMSKTLGFNMVTLLGSREAQQVVAQVMTIKPSLLHSTAENYGIIQALMMGAQRVLDKREFMEDYANRHNGSFYGGDTLFDKINPIERYTSRIEPMRIPRAYEGEKIDDPRVRDRILRQLIPGVIYDTRKISPSKSYGQWDGHEFDDIPRGAFKHFER